MCSIFRKQKQRVIDKFDENETSAKHPDFRALYNNNSNQPPVNLQARKGCRLAGQAAPPGQ